MVATASSAAADISSHVETVHPQFSASTEPVHSSVGVAVRLGSDGSTGNRSESPNSEEPEESCAPMDLSSGGVASQAVMATPSFMMAAAAAAVASNTNTPTSLADSLLNARRLAELVRAQQNLRKEEHATPSKPESSLTPPLLPRKRAWPELQLDLSAMVSEKLKKRTEEPNDNVVAPPPPTSPSESNSSGGTSTTPSSNKEVKKRRLDQLLSKKFSVNDSPPPSNNNEQIPATPTLSEGVAFPIRRDSTEKKQNRRKRSSPVTLSLRPNSELLESPKIEVNEHHQEEKAAEKSIEVSEADESKNALKNQLLQLHLAQAALMNQSGSPLFTGFPGLPGLPGSSPASGPPQNPLLYYGYYAQMIQGLQSQQQKLLEQLTGKVAAKNVLSTANPISSKVIFLSILSRVSYNFTRKKNSIRKEGSNSKFSTTTEFIFCLACAKTFAAALLRSFFGNRSQLWFDFTKLTFFLQPKAEMLPSPFSTPKSTAAPFSPSRMLPTTPLSPPSPRFREDNASPHHLLSSPLSASADEPRRRAPRALTGRYVKSGPGASPRTLAILRKKIEERLKLKELLGDNSSLYFGALKQQKMKPKSVANSRF